MKRTSKRILSILLCCVLAFSCYGALLHSQAAVIDVTTAVWPANSTSEDYKFKPEKTAGYNGYGTPYLLFRNKSLGYTLYPYLEFICKSNNDILYCVEPGPIYSTTSIDTGDFWNSWRNWNRDHGVNDLEIEDAKRLLGLLLKYGYQGKISSDSSVDDIMNAYATQILVWETVTGERDKNFNYIAPNYQSNCQMDRIRDNMPHRDVFKGHYERIENQVKTLNGNQRPSFASNSSDTAPLYKMNYEDGKFVLTIENASGTIGNGVSFSAVADGAPFTEITFSKNGNKLFIESTDEFEGIVNVTVSCKETYAVPVTISDGVYKDFGGQQDLIHIPVVTPENEIPINNVGYFNLEFPHVHRYIPFYTDPDCIHRGYITWVCRCGDSYVNNYTDPLGHNFCPIDQIKPGCTEPGFIKYRCTRCGAAYITETEPTGHSAPVWVTVRRATCTKDGEQVGLCSTCGIALDSRPIAATGHGKTVWKIDQEATADHDGQMTPYCSVCGDAVGASKSFALHKHEPGKEIILLEATCTTAGEMGTFCSVCNACYETKPIEALGHNRTVTVTTTPATCTTDGEQTKYCTTCGNVTETQTISATGHMEGAWDVTTAATCTDDGSETCTCAVCGETINSRVIPALGHDEGVWNTTVPASCTVKGEQVCVCTRCNTVTDTKKIPALGHDDGAWVVSTPASCTLDGERIRTCTRCGKTTAKEQIPKTGHDEGYWTVESEPTATQQGIMNRLCSICGDILERKEFGSHIHTPGYRKTTKNPTCTKAGEGATFCATCNAAYSTYTIEKLGHDYGAWSTNHDGTHKRECSRCHELQKENCKYTVTVVDPTCEKGGYSTYCCDVCGYKRVDDFVDPLGHKFSAWTEDPDGLTHSRVCTRCSLEECEGHDWDEWSDNHDAGLFCAGTKTRHCLICDAAQTEKALHTSWIGQLFYPIILFISNLLNKVFFGVSLNWLFPWLNVEPTM